MAQAKGIAAAALGVLFVLAAGAPARAQVCTTDCDEYTSGQCVHYTEHCVTPAPPAHSFGAIAYGRTSRAFGFSHSWSSQKKAESVAMQNCAKHGSDCEVMVWFDRRCGAVSSGGGTTASWGLGDGDGAARAEAQKKCLSDGGTGCEVQVSHCSR